MRDCVLPFVVALAPLAVAAPALSTIGAASVSVAQSQLAMSFVEPSTTPGRSDAPSSVTRNASDIETLIVANDLALERPVSFWMVIDLQTLSMRERLESSPLLRGDLASAHDARLFPDRVLTLAN